jgi:hypothetical protein
LISIWKAATGPGARSAAASEARAIGIRPGSDAMARIAIKPVSVGDSTIRPARYGNRVRPWHCNIEVVNGGRADIDRVQR